MIGRDRIAALLAFMFFAGSASLVLLWLTHLAVPVAI